MSSCPVLQLLLCRVRHSAKQEFELLTSLGPLRCRRSAFLHFEQEFLVPQAPCSCRTRGRVLSIESYVAQILLSEIRTLRISIHVRVRTLLKWNFHFRVAAGLGCVHAGRNAVKMQFHSCPLGSAGQYDYGNFSVSQVLLVTDSIVGREQEIEARLFSRFQQRAVA